VGSEFPNCVVVGFLKEISGSSGEEAALVKPLVVFE